LHAAGRARQGMVAPPASNHSQRCQPEMPESPKRKIPKSPDSADEAGTPRSLAERVERSLKDVDRLLKNNPSTPPEARVLVQLEQAKVSALLQLAEAIRETRRADGPPRA